MEEVPCERVAAGNAMGADCLPLSSVAVASKRPRSEAPPLLRTVLMRTAVPERCRGRCVGSRERSRGALDRGGGSSGSNITPRSRVAKPLADAIAAGVRSGRSTATQRGRKRQRSGLGEAQPQVASGVRRAPRRRLRRRIREGSDEGSGGSDGSDGSDGDEQSDDDELDAAESRRSEPAGGDGTPWRPRPRGRAPHDDNGVAKVWDHRIGRYVGHHDR